MKIAICDDDVSFTSKLEEIIKQESVNYGKKPEIDVFFDGETLVKSIEDGQCYSMIFLDIEMKKMNGITAARRIRQLDRYTLIIYISSYDDYLKELFEVEPFRFISKPLQLQKLKQYFGEAIRKIEGLNNIYSYSYNKEEYTVPIKEIVYFESNKRLINIRMNDGTERSFYGKLNNIEKEIQKINKHFIRIHQSFLVNYSYVKRMTYSEVVLEHNYDELVLRISEDRRSTVRRKVCEIAGGLQLYND
ncbi:MAG: response regulator transcription factor [Pseudobutyrivibrio sp.]|uniref:LytR/AlgR family response regulator transcription factor n=1 Tax=Pseudobutyrivibrio sp. TaxID=2014367 RepID=UPI0025F75214|nr:LytTR family DNA-binding domain-containing protein [Pseudobutyrivibrio sp.]MBE5903498.1 response regulator transcription factor [Pseudobutyrivibrio sp.]